MKRAIAMLATLFLATGCLSSFLSSGHVIEMVMPLAPPDGRAAQELALVEILGEVAQEMGMRVDDPIRVYGRVAYTAKYGNGAISGFSMNMEFSDHVSIVFRSLEDVPTTTAERAFALFKPKLDERGLKYTVRRV